MKRPEGYLWIRADEHEAYCPGCAARVYSYAQIIDGEMLVCCCKCQRILYRETAAEKESR